ncbi:MAG TPA: choice-of-anchor R domain-containing protein [Bryobacteraceae bacterium]|nr:choice-of-anchor R domain-containing protein [Bryobacteraceae bacterium]
MSTAGRLFTIAGWAAFLGMSAVPMRADILSNNLFKTPSATYTVSGNTLVAASFRTGASASTLNSATLLLANLSPGQGTLSIWSDVNGRPGTQLGTLNTPSSFSSNAAAITFTATGINLAANTNYWLVFRPLSGSFDWSWSGDNTGEGPGFLHMYSVSGDGGSNWYSSSVNQPLMLVTATAAGNTCNFNLSPATATAAAAGSSGAVTVTTGGACTAVPVSSVNWITTSAGSSGIGSGALGYTVAANFSQNSRIGTVNIGGQAFIVTQAGSSCSYSLSPTSFPLPASGGSGTITVTTGSGCPYTVSPSAPGLTFPSGLSGSGSGAVNFAAPANNTSSPLVVILTIGGQQVTITQPSNVCFFTVSPLNPAVPAAGGALVFTVTGTAGCTWTTTSNASWLTTIGTGSGSGSGTVTIFAAPAPGGQRSGTVTIAGQTITINQTGASCTYSLSGTGATYTANGGSGNITITTQAGCPFNSAVDSPFITITSGASGGGTSTLSYTVQPLAGSLQRTGTITIAGIPFTIVQTVTTQTALRFVPVTPCRVADTRLGTGPFGGPRMNAGETRNFLVPQSACGIPSNAAAYALNLTVVPPSGLAFATLWPTGQAQPFVSTINSFDGRIKANAAIVPAGSGGGVSVFVSHATDIVLDINGYFIPATAGAGLAFYPVTPCRISDTRLASGPLGGPALTGGQSRTIAVQSACGLPASAQAYSLNVTVVPRGPLAFLTLWPAGQSQPNVSTLNALTGVVTANAAIVPAGASGALNVFATNDTDLVIDVNGYFAPPGAGGLSFYNVTPCRVSDTRLGAGPFGGPALAPAQTRTIGVSNSACGILSTAQAYSLNATVIPQTTLDYLTLWGAGLPQPFVSTLNSFDGSVVANAAIVPAGSGGVNAFATKTTDLVLDINGYFAP